MRAVFNALWFLLVLVIVGCAQGPASTFSFQENTGSTLLSATTPTSGSIGTEGGGNAHTMTRVFWHEWDDLALCLERLYPNEKSAEAKLEWQIFAQNLRDLSDREEKVKIGNFKQIIALDESTRNELSHGDILLSMDYFQYDLFGKYIFLINYANRYGRTRLEWNSNNVGRAAYLCAPGTVL